MGACSRACGFGSGFWQHPVAFNWHTLTGTPILRSAATYLPALQVHCKPTMCICAHTQTCPWSQPDRLMFAPFSLGCSADARICSLDVPWCQPAVCRAVRATCRCLERVINRHVVQLTLPADLSEAPPDEMDRVQVGG